MILLRLSLLVSSLGLLLSSLSLLPAMMIHFKQANLGSFLPFTTTLKESLDREYQRERITGRTLDYLHTGLHILEENAVYVSVSFLVFSVVNLALDFFLLVGSCCKIRLLMLPWLLVSMLELVLLGGPLVLVTDILVLHLLSVQGHLLPCLLLTNIPALLTILLMSAWCLVLAAYVSLGPAQVDQQAEGRQGGLEVECEVRSRASQDEEL